MCIRDRLHQPIIPSEVVENLQDALDCADRIGYPVIVRPAFNMGGTGGGICETREKLIEIGIVSADHGQKILHHNKIIKMTGVYMDFTYKTATLEDIDTVSYTHLVAVNTLQYRLDYC